MKYKGKKKFVAKGGKPNNSIATSGAIPSTLPKESSGSNSLYFRYNEMNSKGHEETSKVLNVNFPKKPNSTGVRKQHVVGTLCRSRLLQ